MQSDHAQHAPPGQDVLGACVKPSEEWIHVEPQSQRLRLLRGGHLLREFAVSTAERGLGERHGSQQTPRGWHIVRAKVGQDAPLNAVFVARRRTGEILTPELFDRFPERDWVLTRILWLSGLELGRNRLSDCDTMRRFIYIHGSPENAPMGVPGSHGCIRMRGADVIELFDLVEVGTKLFVGEALTA